MWGISYLIFISDDKDLRREGVSNLKTGIHLLLWAYQSCRQSFVSITHRVPGSVSHLVFPSLLVCLLLVGGFSILLPHSCSVGFTADTVLQKWEGRIATRLSRSVPCFGFSETIFVQFSVDSGSVYPQVCFSSVGRNLVWKLVSYQGIYFPSGKSSCMVAPNAVNCRAGRRDVWHINR